ncbi:prostaglandin reductase 2-like isoform X1 [Diadema setosum]|uniref:prostaglandin reductase 2-like isoform X1 n=2 Tax=Diadema setosum TaxID=31175 RepID=UPI003B3B8777
MVPSNKRVILRCRPGDTGVPEDDNFAAEDCPFPTNLADDQMLVKTLCLSVDPYMRSRMNQKTRAQYMMPWRIGETVDGGGVAIVIESKNDQYQAGDIIQTFSLPWQLYSHIGPSPYLYKVDKALVGEHFSLAMGAVGMPGLTSLFGIRHKGHVKPGANQTMVISGAAGACGSIAGQIARIEGCSRVVGICGTNEKCQFLTEQLGFDSAINYKTENVAETLKTACPAGIDVYFDNVGGDISNCVIAQMNKDSHIVLCGQISMYNNLDKEYPPLLPDDIADRVKKLGITRERFVVLTYAKEFPEGMYQLATWVKEGKLKVKETVVEGLENTGAAFVSMMKGGNIGKMIVHVADP